MKGTELIVKALEEVDVEYIFSIPGDHILGVYDCLKKSKIKTIVPTHEPSAGFMADVYGRITGKPGIALLIAGPGVLNVVNSVAQAYVESSPVVIIASQCDSTQWGKGLYHELEHPDAQMEIFKDITKWQARIEKASEIPDKILEGVYIAMQDRKGPVYIEIPTNLFEQEAEYKKSNKKQISLKKANEKEIKETVDTLIEAENPVIYAGGGTKTSKCSKELIELAEKLNIPVATTLMGKGVVPEDHDLSLGCGAGNIGNDAAVRIINKADVMLAVGTRFDVVGTGFFTIKVPEKLIHIEIDKKEINRNYPAHLGLEGDAKTVLNQILAELKKREYIKKRGEIKEKINEIHKEEKKKLKKEISHEGENIDPYLLLDELNKIVKEESILIGDAGNSLLWSLEYPINKGQEIHMPAGYNSMGFSVPGVIAAKLASPSKKVMGLCGDGSFLMTGMEFLTAVRYNLDVNIFVLHDKRYNLLTFFQDMKYKGEHTDTLLKTFSFKEFANMLGGLGIEIKKPEEIKTKLKKGVDYKGPTLFEVHIDPEKKPPISRRLLKLLSKKTLSGK